MGTHLPPAEAHQAGVQTALSLGKVGVGLAEELKQALTSEILEAIKDDKVIHQLEARQKRYEDEAKAAREKVRARIAEIDRTMSEMTRGFNLLRAEHNRKMRSMEQRKRKAHVELKASRPRSCRWQISNRKQVVMSMVEHRFRVRAGMAFQSIKHSAWKLK